MSEPIIRIEGLRKSFGENHVIRGVDLEVYRGEILALIGKSGVGKSILLKLLIDLIEPDDGRILFDGRPLAQLGRAERRAIRRKMSYVFQGTALLDSLTVYQNVALPLQERLGVRGAQIRQRVREKLRQLDLAGIEDAYPSQLSGGMKKRVALARALVTEPEIVLFDEPTTGLDPIRRHAVHSLITDYQRQFGFTAVLVTHEIPDIFYISQRIAMLDEGRIIFAGTPEQLRLSPDPVIQTFINGGSAAAAEHAMAHPAELERCLSGDGAVAAGGDAASMLIFLTLDNLPELNRRFGYLAGQDAMKHLLAGVRSLLRTVDTAARVGLDRVVVLLPGAGREEAAAFRTRLGGLLARSELLAGAASPGFCLSISAGYAEALPGSRLAELLDVAATGMQPLGSLDNCSPAEVS